MKVCIITRSLPEPQLLTWLFMDCLGSSKFTVCDTRILYRHHVFHGSKINEETRYIIWIMKPIISICSFGREDILKFQPIKNKICQRCRYMVMFFASVHMKILMRNLFRKTYKNNWYKVTNHLNLILFWRRRIFFFS